MVLTYISDRDYEEDQKDERARVARARTCGQAQKARQR